MIGIITVGDQGMADRYAYIPYIGLFIALVWGASKLASAYKIPRLLLTGSVVLVLGVLGCLTYRQLGYWKDKETLWRYTLSVTENNYVAHNNLALILGHSGRDDEAIVHFEAARRLHKYPPDQIVKLGAYELRMGHPLKAVETCKAAVAATSDSQIRLVAWTQMGRALLQLRRYDEAAESYQQALFLAPDEQEGLIGSGLLALRSGDLSRAVAELSQAAKGQPSDVNSLLLAQALRRSDQRAEADRALVQARKISANLSQAQATVADYLALVGLRPL
jgi:tetratricopeptide (TPR) repeat protein